MAVRTVSQVTAHLKQALENDPMLSDLLVEAEVSNLRVSGAGHSYFTLKDDESVLNCVMFRGRPGAGLLQNGNAVLAHGHITFYEPRGTTEFMVDLAMAAGVGELALKLEQLRQRLEAEGLFDRSRKRLLPRFPKAIGVVTSPSGAVFHDIQNVVRQRYPLAELLLAPSSVQGDMAAGEIANALGKLNDDGRSDVIIVARGGGSLEDLWPFNEESVARAIYASRIPVVSAVGHETDHTIADDVADLRAPTPPQRRPSWRRPTRPSCAGSLRRCGNGFTVPRCADSGLTEATCRTYLTDWKGLCQIWPPCGAGWTIWPGCRRARWPTV